MRKHTRKNEWRFRKWKQQFFIPSRQVESCTAATPKADQGLAGGIVCRLTRLTRSSPRNCEGARICLFIGSVVFTNLIDIV